MSPSAYFIALPIGIIALSGWAVKVESDNYLQSRSNTALQQMPIRVADRLVLQPEVPRPSRFDHDRYGTDSSETGNVLGDTISRRPIGERAGSRTAWLDAHPYHISNSSAQELPEIPGYVEAPDQSLLQAFQTVPLEAGFHITADEATKVDMSGQTVMFNGNVSLTSPQFQLKSDKLTVHLGADKKSFNRAVAVGNVHVQLLAVAEDKRYRGQSGTAVYEPSKSMITMTNWPRIQGQGQELIGAEPNTKVFLYTQTGKMLTEGRAQTRVASQFVTNESPALKN